MQRQQKQPKKDATEQWSFHWWREVLCSVTDLSTVTSLLMVHLLKSSCVATMAKLSKPSSKPLKIASGCINLPHLTDMQFVFGKALNRPAAARELVKCLLTILHNRTMHAGRQKLLHMVRNGTAIGICVTLFELKDIAMGDCLLSRWSLLPRCRLSARTSVVHFMFVRISGTTSTGNCICVARPDSCGFISTLLSPRLVRLLWLCGNSTLYLWD